METAAKLAILADAAKYDASCASSGTTKRNSTRGGGSAPPRLRDLPQLHAGRALRFVPRNPAHELLHLRLPLLHQPRLRDVQRARSRRKSVQLTLDFIGELHRGLFLSSGIIRNPDYTMEQGGRGRVGRCRGASVSAATFNLRRSRGIAGAHREADLATRISIKHRTANEVALDQLAPEKNLARRRRR
jgi:predicted DNA-binding helix-hairpin-helix protein